MPPRTRRVLTTGIGLIAAAWLSPVRPGVVVGRSMDPTLAPGQPFLYTRQLPGEPLRRGDVVVVRLAGAVCVKRVFAVGGDHFYTFQAVIGPMDDCKLLPPNTPLLRWRRRYPRIVFLRRSVAPGQVFVVGDGPTSVDSRRLGSVPAADVLGRVISPSVGPLERGTNVLAWSELPQPPRLPHRS